MGYYTDFEIIEASEEAANALKEKSGYTWYNDMINAKWYDWEKHLAEVSAQFPKETILLQGTGEEPGDLWGAKAKSGVVVIKKARIIWDD